MSAIIPALDLSDPLVAVYVGWGLELAERDLARDGQSFPPDVAEPLRELMAYGRMLQQRAVSAARGNSHRSNGNGAHDLTVNEAAELLPFDPPRVRQLLRSGALAGRRDEQGRWWIERAAVEAFKAERGTRR